MKEKKVKPSKKSSSSVLHDLGYRVLGKAPAKVFPSSEKIRTNLLRANVRINHVIYISSMFFWSIIALVLGAPIVYFVLLILLPILLISLPTLFLIGLSVLAGFLSFIVTLAVFLYYPTYKASIVKSKIDKNLVYTANYMAILTGSGATPGQTFTSLINIGEFFGLSESARTIAKNVELLGEDLITALTDESKITPSKMYSTFLQGYVATMQTGGDLHAYLMVMSEKFSEVRRRLLEKMIDQLGLAGELYITLLVAFPIIMITLLSVMGALGGDVIGGLSAAQLMPLMVYLGVPVMAIVVLIFTDAILASW